MTINMKKHEAAVDKALAKLKTFLMKPDHGDGEWPKVSDEELTKAYDLVGEVLDLKWGQDVDGDAPVRVRIWHRAQEHPVADFAFIAHGPHREDESADAREARWLSNLNTISSASAACAEELRRLHIEMADVRSRTLRKNAAFEVYPVRYKPTPEWDSGVHGRDYPASLHKSEADAEQFIQEQEKLGMVVDKRSIMLTTPSFQDSPSDRFAGFQRKVAEHFGKLLPETKARQDLSLQHVRTIRKSETAG